MFSAVFRIVLGVALGWCALAEVAEAFANALFRMHVDGDWFLLIAASSGDELREFLRLYGVQLTLAVSALLALLALIIAGVFFAKGRFGWILPAVVILYAGWSCRTTSKAVHWAPVYLAYDTVRSAAQYAELIRAGSWNSASRTSPVSHHAVSNLVVVIGESMTTDRMSLYGYAKKTTPHLDVLRDRLTVLPPVRPTHTTTVPALRMLLTRATLARPDRAIETLPAAFRRRGYSTFLISAQPKWGRYCGVERFLFAACESQTYLVDNERGVAVPDEEVVDSFRRELSVNEKRPFVAFLHLQGSHFDPKWRVPPDFVTPEGFDDYDRSIVYTDHVLNELIAALPPRTMMIYLSDHGESPDSSSWRNARAPSMWRVPFIVYPRIDPVPAITCLDQFFEWVWERCEGCEKCGII